MIWILVILVLLLGPASCAEDDSSSPNNNASDNDSSSPDDDDDDDNDDDDDLPPHFQVGFSRIDITPEVPVKLAGYDMFFLSENFCRWSTDVHDPLYAHAMAFDDSEFEAPVIMVVLDLIGLMVGDANRIRNGIAQELGISTGSVIVTSTHTHHGPDTIGIWGLIIPPISGRQEQVIDEMIDKAITAGLDAWDNREPASLAYAVGEEPDLHENIIEEDPDRMIDDTVTLVAAYDDKGQVLGSLLNWSAHPTVMGQDSTVITSDFPGVYYRVMEEQIGGVHIFINGAIGAMIQPINKWQNPDEWDEVEWTGQGLADDALELLDIVEVIENPRIEYLESSAASITLTNPVFTIAQALGLIARDIPPLGESALIPITAFGIGPVKFATLPGEFVPDYAYELRDIIGGQAQFLIGLGQDWIGYVLTPDQAKNVAYLYERILSPGPETGEHVMDAYRSMSNKLGR